MKSRFVTALMLFVTSASVFAGQCEDNFVKKGNALTGTEYSTSLKVAGLSVPSAIGQMRNLAIADGMDVLDESAESGSLLLEEPENFTHKSLPIQVTAKADGGAADVGILMKTRRGAFGSADGIKTAMCKMLTQLKPGKEPVARTAAAQKPIEMLATTLASQVERQAKDNATVIGPRYEGKVYNLKGWNSGVHGKKGSYSVFFDMKPGDDSMESVFQTKVMCVLAADQNAFAMTLREHDRLHLTGTFDEYDSLGGVIVLRECKSLK